MRRLSRVLLLAVVATVGAAVVPTATAMREVTPPLDREAQRWVEAALRSLSDEELVGQLIVPRFDATFISADSDEWDRLAGLVRDIHAGGFIAFGGTVPVPRVALNATYDPVTLGQPLELAATLNRLQTAARLPLLMSADFEYGAGMRLHGATRFPRAMPLGATRDPALARAVGRATAVEARAMGIHVNFAPVADVNDNPRNPVINTRSFGENPQQVAAMVAAYVEGLQEGGALATVKHFPGHGNTDVDTHLGLARLPHDRARLDAVELVPFRAGIAAGTAAVMVGHLELPALDPAPGPATFSAPVLTGLLRQGLGFEGLIYPDSLRMQALEGFGDSGEVAVRTLEAGADVVLDPDDPRAAFAGVRAALTSGRLTRARLQASARRLLAAKARLGLHRRRTVSLDALPEQVGTRAHRALAQQVAARSITLVRDARTSVPLRLAATSSVLYVSVLDYASGWRSGAPARTLLPALRATGAQVDALELTDRSTPDQLDLVRLMASRYDAVVLGLFVRASSGSGRMDLAPPVGRLLQDLAAASARSSRPLVALGFGSPYVAAALPTLPTMLLAYDFGDEAEAAIAAALLGQAPIGGQLPVAVSEELGVGAQLVREP